MGFGCSVLEPERWILGRQILVFSIIPVLHTWRPHPGAWLPAAGCRTARLRGPQLGQPMESLGELPATSCACAGLWSSWSRSGASSLQPPRHHVPPASALWEPEAGMCKA